jgi:hypothetical protein
MLNFFTILVIFHYGKWKINDEIFHSTWRVPFYIPTLKMKLAYAFRTVHGLPLLKISTPLLKFKFQFISNIKVHDALMKKNVPTHL